ncbi:TRAP transporter large permease subunit [Chloroflexota bacterium]
MEWYVIGILMIAILIFASLLNIPIAVCLGLMSFGFLVCGEGLVRASAALNTQLIGMWTSYYVMAVPLFVFMAEFLLIGAVTEGLFDMASKWFRRLPGALAIVSIVACAIFSAMSGSTLGAGLNRAE